MFADILKYVLLGVIQGISEFLPISSSGHLAVFEHFLGIENSNIQFEVVVHFATLLSVFTVMRKVLINLFLNILNDLKLLKLKSDSLLFLYKIILATIPVGIVGIFFKSEIETLFNNMTVIALAFCFTGLLLFSTRFLKINDRSTNIEDIKTINFKQALIVGFFQSIAVIPGVSRSGITIVSGLMSKINNISSVYFSFIISIPAILGAFFLETKQMISNPESIETGFLIAGFISAYLSGVLGLNLILKVAKHKKLDYFAPYLITLGLVLLIII